MTTTAQTPGRHWGNLILSLLEIVVGVLLIIDPLGFSSAIIVTSGIILTLVGIYFLFNYFRHPIELAATTFDLAKGLGLTLFGVFCITRSGWFISTFPLLSVLFGLMLLIGGICKIQWATDMLRFKQKRWYIPMINAVATLVLALLILLNPFTSAGVLWSFIAISMIASAMLDIITFLTDRK